MKESATIRQHMRKQGKWRMEIYMPRKAKGTPRPWLTASNLLIAHLAFHVIFVFGYWFSLAAGLSFSNTDIFQNHAAVLSDMLTNHLGLLIVLVIHAGAVVASKWWGRRQQRAANQQLDSIDDHMTAEQKLELLLDEVVDLREALHEQGVVEQDGNPDLTTDRPRGQSQTDLDAMIRLKDYQAANAGQGS